MVRCVRSRGKSLDSSGVGRRLRFLVLSALVAIAFGSWTIPRSVLAQEATLVQETAAPAGPAAEADIDLKAIERRAQESAQTRDAGGCVGGRRQRCGRQSRWVRPDRRPCRHEGGTTRDGHVSGRARCAGQDAGK